MKDLKKEISSIIKKWMFSEEEKKYNFPDGMTEPCADEILALFEKRDRELIEKIKEQRKYVHISELNPKTGKFEFQKDKTVIVKDYLQSVIELIKHE